MMLGSPIGLGIGEIRNIMWQIGDQESLIFDAFEFQEDQEQDYHSLLVWRNGIMHEPIILENEWIRDCVGNEIEKRKTAIFLREEICQRLDETV